MLAVLGLLSAVPCVEAKVGCSVDTKVSGAAVRMVVDTGADITVLSEDAARRVGIRIDRNSPIVPIRSANGLSLAALARARVEVGPHREEDVMIAVVPELGNDGLLGMSFLERYQVSLGGKSLELKPIDEGEPKRGGHGESWWSLRFQRARDRLQRYESALPAARNADKATVREIGSSPGEVGLEELIRRLRDFMQAEMESLATEAARHSVPHEWRR